MGNRILVTGGAGFIGSHTCVALAEAGRLIWERRGERLFAVGSQGVQQALVAHWRAAGLLEARPAAAFRAPAAERIVAVSGSCSPVTAPPPRSKVLPSLPSPAPGSSTARPPLRSP